MKILSLHIMLFFCVVLNAQTFHVKRAPLFENNEQQDVEHIFEDAQGLIHVITEKGIYAFDGIDYQRVKFDGDLNWPVLAVESRFKSGDVWLSLSSGRVVCYSLSTCALSHDIKVGTGNEISKMLATEHGVLYLVSKEGALFSYNIADAQLEQLALEPINDIYEIASDASGNLWLATDDGLIRYNESNGVKKFKMEEGVTDDIIYSISYNHGRLLAGSYEQGLFLFDQERQYFDQLDDDWKYGPIQQILSVDDESVFLRTPRHGVIAYYFKNKASSQVRSKLDMQIINPSSKIYIDSQDEVWYADQKRVLSRFSRQFEFYELSGSQEIQTIHACSKYDGILGTNRGAFFYDLTKNEAELVSGSDEFNIVCADKLGDYVLMGTFDRGLISVNLKSKTTRPFSEFSALKNNSIISIAHHADTIWLSTLAGVYVAQFELNEKKLEIRNLKKFNLLSTNYVYDLLIKNSTVYFATDGDGVAIWENGELTYIPEDENKNTQVYSVIEATDEAIYVGESSNKLCKLNRETNELQCTYYQSKVELASLCAADDGSIYLFHADGLDCLHLLENSLSQYGLEHGFKDFEPQLNAVSSLGGESMVVAGGSQFAKINTSVRGHVRSHISIQSAKAGNETLDLQEESTLAANDNTILFSIGGQFYNQSEPLSFYYKLNGHDADWVLTKDRSIIYSKLGAGTYEFKIAIDSASISGQEEFNSSYKFEILPPVWRRSWFVILALLLSSSIVYAFMKFREIEFKRQKEIERVNVERQYEVLKSQLNPHFLFNAFNTLVSYIEEDPTTAVEVVERLSDFYRRILEVKERRLVTIQEELHLLDDYAYLLNKRFNNNLILEVDIENKQTYIPTMTLQILVENAVKHNVLSGQHKLFVTIKDAGDDFIEIVNEKRKKRTMGKSTGIGLKNIDKRYKLLSFDGISIFDKKDRFVVRIPKIKSNIL